MTKNLAIPTGWLNHWSQIRTIPSKRVHIGGIPTNPSEKWWSESQLGWWNSQYTEKIKHVPKHQPDMITKVKSNKPFSAMSSGPVPDMSEEQALPWTKVVLSKDTFWYPYTIEHQDINQLWHLAMWGGKSPTLTGLFWPFYPKKDRHHPHLTHCHFAVQELSCYPLAN